MRLAALLLLPTFALWGAPHEAAPSEVRDAVANFRPEGPKGWSFTQTTVAAGRKLVERYDSARPEFNRWTLIAEDGKAPTAEEAARYRQKFTRHSQHNGAPRLNDQIDLTSLRLIDESPERGRYEARLKTTESGDRTAAFLSAIIVWHKSSAAIESFTIASTGPFSPSFGVKIEEMRTTMTYSLPTREAPALLQTITTRLRGRAFWVKSLDADMEVIYSDYVPIRKNTPPRGDQRP